MLVQLQQGPRTYLDFLPGNALGRRLTDAIGGLWSGRTLGISSIGAYE